MPDRKGFCMKASSIGVAALVTALLAVLVISLPIPVAAGAAASAPASVPASAPASAPATRAAADLPVGTLMPVAEIVEDTVSRWGFGYQGTASFYSSSFGSAPADCGVANPRAVVCKLRGGVKHWSAALDSRSADDPAVNVLRLDVTGADDFRNPLVLPLKENGSTAYRIDGVAVNLEWNGKTIPVMVQGWYNRSVPASQPADEGGNQVAAPPSRYLSLTVGTAMAGTCRFGDKVCAVKVADTNGNLALGEPVQLLGYSRGVMQARGNGGDSVVVLAQDGTRASRAMLGHPLLVDGVWYDVTVGPGATTMEAAARTEPAGTVVIDADKWSAMLIQGKTTFCISGGREGVKVPAGEYDIATYQQSSGRGEEFYSLSIPSNSESKPETRRIKVEAGATLALKIGAPLTGTLKSAASATLGGERTLTTTVAYHDVGGREATLQLAGGTLLKITIKDEAGTELTSGPVSYG